MIRRLLVLLATPMLPCTALNAQPQLPRWTVSPTPMLTLSDNGQPSTQFNRVLDVTRLPGGDIVVMDGASQEMRVFTSKGSFVRALSRAGAGPGEIRGASGLVRAGDTLLVLEGMPAPPQLHRFTLKTGFVDRQLIRAGTPRQAWSGLGRLATGELLSIRGSFSRAAPPEPRAVTRDTITLGLVSLGDSTLIWTQAFPNVEYVGYAVSNSAARTAATRHILGAALSIAVSGDQSWICDSGTGKCLIYDGRGTLRNSIDVPLAPRAFDEAALVRARDQALESAPGVSAKERIAAAYDPAVRPRRAPRFSNVLEGFGGEVLIEEFAELPDSPRRYIVLDRAGRAIAEFGGPARFIPKEVGADYIVGTQADADGAERVVMYSLRRG